MTGLIGVFGCSTGFCCDERRRRSFEPAPTDPGLGAGGGFPSEICAGSCDGSVGSDCLSPIDDCGGSRARHRWSLTRRVDAAAAASFDGFVGPELG